MPETDVTTEQREETEKKLDLAFRLRRALVQISERRPTIERVRLDGFLRFISPAKSMVRSKGVDFPVTCRRHGSSKERTTESTRTTALYFHVGNAVLGFYDFIEATRNVELSPDQVAEIEKIATARVELLESIARKGLDAYRLDGSPMTGFRLEYGLPDPKPAA